MIRDIHGSVWWLDDRRFFASSIEGKTNQCLSQYDFPSVWHVALSDNHWSNKITMKKRLFCHM